MSSQAALAALTESGGNIVNVASDAGVIGYPLGAAYSAAKGAIRGMSKSMHGGKGKHQHAKLHERKA